MSKSHRQKTINVHYNEVIDILKDQGIKFQNCVTVPVEILINVLFNFTKNISTACSSVLICFTGIFMLAYTLNEHAFYVCDFF